MSDLIPLLKFTPSAQAPEVLEATTVQREPLITRLVESVLAEKSGTRHHLLVGPRGIGKTHVLSLLASRIRAGKQRDSVVVGWLDEDPWAVRTYDKFLAAVIARVAEEIGDPELGRLALTLRSRSPGGDGLEGEALLRRAVGDRRLVVLVENLDEIFRRIGPDGQSKLRAFAEDWSQLLIIATTPQLFSGVRRHASPFYGFFAVTHLEELSLDNAMELLKKVAHLRGDSELVEFLGTDKATSRMTAVQALTGGHPRVWLLLAGCISIGAIDELVPLFLEALDDLTPYYQDRLRALGDQQQEILMLLSEAGGALSNRALAERSGIAQNQVANIMRQLDDRGYIRRAELPRDLAQGDRRMSFWELREPLMRLCLDVKQARGEPLRIVVEFLRVWYGPRLLEELLSLPSSPSLATTYVSEALRALDDKTVLHALLRDSSQDILALAERGLSLLPEHAGLQLAKAAGLAMDGQFVEARKLVVGLIESNRISESDPAVRMVLALVQQALGEPVDLDAVVADAFEMRRAPEDVDSAMLVAIAYHLSDRFEEALATWDEAINLDPGQAEAHAYRGDTLGRLGRHRDALDAHSRAVELEPNNPTYHGRRGIDLASLGDSDEALAAFTRAAELAPGDPDHHFYRSVMLRRLGREEEALSAIERALELDPTDAVLHDQHGIVLGTLDRSEEAVVAHREAVENDPSNATYQHNLGASLSRAGLLDEGLAAYERAVDLNADNPAFHNAYGSALNRMARHEQALTAFTRAADIDSSNSDYHDNRGIALLNLGRDEEALAAFTRAVELAPSDEGYHARRGIALDRLDRPEEALEAYTMATALNPEDPSSHNQRAHILRLLGHLEEAEAAAALAIELDEQDAVSRFTLTEVVLTSGDIERALVLLQEALDIWRQERTERPGDTDLLCRIVWERFRGDLRRRGLIAQIVTLYRQADSLEELGRGMVSSIPLFVDPRVAQSEADAWAEEWAEALFPSDSEIPLRLMKAAAHWKRDGDKAHLLALPSEQREILVRLLEPISA